MLFHIKTNAQSTLTATQLLATAQEQNTVQGYTDYIQIKGSRQEAVDNIKSLLQKTGYVMIEESNGNVLIESAGEGFWKPKSARSIRKGVIGVDKNSERNGDVIIKGQVFVILHQITSYLLFVHLKQFQFVRHLYMNIFYLSQMNKITEPLRVLEEEILVLKL